MTKPEDNKHEDHEQDKSFTIIVNARPKVVTERALSFDAIIRLAFDPAPTSETTMFTVTYRKGEGNKPEGTLVEGETVKVKEGMIFNVTATNKS